MVIGNGKKSKQDSFDIFAGSREPDRAKFARSWREKSNGGKGKESKDRVTYCFFFFTLAYGLCNLTTQCQI